MTASQQTHNVATTSLQRRSLVAWLAHTPAASMFCKERAFGIKEHIVNVHIVSISYYCIEDHMIH